MSVISKKEALSLCKSCKSWGKKGCIATDIEASKEEYVVLQECLKAEIESAHQKILPLHKPIENEGDTFEVPDSIYEPPFLSTKGEGTKKVGQWFIRHPDYHVTPMLLAGYCHISHESAKKICSRWYKKGWLQQSLQNHYEYQQRITASELETLTKMETVTLHNLMMNLPQGLRDKRGVSPVSGTAQQHLDGDTKNNTYRGVISGSGTVKNSCGTKSFEMMDKQAPTKTLETLDNRGMPQSRIKIFEYEKNTIIYIKCSENPLDILSFERTMGYIEGAGYSLQGATFDRIEVNVDIPSLQISGTKAIELRTMTQCFQRYYNKKGKLRKEFILRGAHIPLEEVLAVMRGEQALGTNVLSIELQKTKKEFEKIKEHLIKSNDHYRQVITTIKENNEKSLRLREKKLKEENERLKKQLSDESKGTENFSDTGELPTHRQAPDPMMYG